jgi:hypothetical protein
LNSIQVKYLYKKNELKLKIQTTERGEEDIWEKIL